jgi:phage I-like protein
MADQDYATVSGMKVDKSDFGYAPGDKPSEWKFPLHDKDHVESAIEMYHHEKGIPPAAMAALKRKIVERAHKFGVDAAKVERFEQRTEKNRDSGLGFRDSGTRAPNPESRISIAVLLTGPGAPVEMPVETAMHGAGAQLREIAVAVPGSWVKGERKFTIKKGDLGDMVRNFGKRKNDMIVIDYEHASEQPEVAKGGPIPGAGWIHALQLRSADLQVGMPASRPALHALVEWTPQAEEMLRTGQYRFFSPAIDWGARDKETGEPQGATLTSGALTNHPFLEELPPIMLSDGTLLGSGLGTRDSGLGNNDPPRSTVFPNPEHRTPNTENPKGAIRMSDEKKKAEEPEEKLADAGDPETMSDEENSGEGHGLPMLRVHKGRTGTKHEGHHIFSAGGKMLGCMSENSLKSYAKKHLGASAEKASEVIDVTKLILTEVAKDGKLNNQRASELAAESRITLADYIRAQEAEKLIDGAIQAGKILPRDRKFFFRDALERPAEFAEYVKGAPQAVKLGVHGIGEAEGMSPDQEVTALTKKLIEEKKLQYPAAMKQVLSENPALADRYRAAHSTRVNADGTAN